MAKKKQAGAGGTPATVALTRAGVEHAVHTYEHDPGAASYGLEAADVMGLDPGRVFKTLLVRVDPSTGSGGAGRLVVGIVPVSGQLDLKAVATAVGGISPLGQKRRHPTVVDPTALGHPTVFVSGGRRGMEIELAPGDLVAQTRATVAPIRR